MAPTPPSDGGGSVFRVAVADDDRNVLAALGGLVDDEPRLELRGTFADGFGLLDCCRREHLDAALIDIAMPGGGPDLARDIRAARPHTIVVVHTAHGDRRNREAMLAAGAAAILHKGRTLDVTGALLDLLQRPTDAPDGDASGPRP